MGFLCCTNKVEPEESKERDTLSPIKNRRCQDLFWLLLFLGAAGFSAYISKAAFYEGDLDILKFGVSTNNTLCGRDSEIDNPKLLFCFNGTGALDYSTLFFKVCVPECPSTGAELEAIFDAKADEFVAASNIDESVWTASNYLLVKQMCVAPTFALLNRCILDVSVVNATVQDLFYTNGQDPADSSLAQAGQMFLNAYHDIKTTWYVILACGVGGGLVFSFIWLQCLRFFATPIVWITVLVFFGGMIAIDYLLAGKAGYTSGIGIVRPTGSGGEFDTTPVVEQEYEFYYKHLFWIFIGLTVVFVFVMIFMFNRIMLAITLIHEAADVIGKIPQILLTPVIPVVLVGAIFMYGLFTTAFLASTGTLEEGQLKFDSQLRHLMIFQIFFCMWVMFFAQGLQSVVMAGTVATFYWTHDKKEVSSPVSRSFWRATRYHTGSIAFGSLILNCTRFLKWFLMQLSRKLKKYGGSSNPLIKFLICCLGCCMWCFEKFIKFITKNAYIMIAVDGTSFCKSAQQGWSLIMSNIARMTAVNIVTAYVFFLSKVGIAFCAAVGATWWVEQRFVFDGTNDDVTSPFAPSVCAFILAYFVAFLFYEAVDFTIDTLLLCFCLDDLKSQHNPQHQPYASPRLLKFMANAPKLTHHDAPY